MKQYVSTLSRYLLVLFAVLVAAPHADRASADGAAQYYVDSVRGSDENPGTSPEQPWKTLNAVQKRVLAPGDSVNFAAGSVWDGGLGIYHGGTEGAPITYRAYGAGPRPTVRRPSGRRNGAIVVQAAWIVLDGLRVTESDENGIILWQAEHVAVRNCEVTGVGLGIAVYGRRNAIAGNYVHDLHMVRSTPGGDDDYGAVGVALFGPDNEVAYNRLERCIAPSHDYGTDGGAVEFFGEGVNGNYVHHNWAQETDGFLEIGGGSAAGNRVAYNVAVDCGGFAWVHLTGKFGSDVSDVRLENNTIVDTTEGPWRDEVFGFTGEPGPGTLIVRNNIVYANRFHTVSRSAAFTHEHNVYYLAASDSPGFSLGATETVADPRFVSLTSNDFHLMSDSPAVDAGNPLEYTVDFEGGAVPARSLPSAGAFEYQGAGEGPDRARQTVDLPLVMRNE